MTDKMELTDVNNDGKIDSEDAEIFSKISEKNNQKMLSWASLISIFIVTILLLSPFVTENRVSVLSELLEIFYISQTSIVGFYMGASTYLESKK